MADIRAGMKRSALMKKYGLSSNELESVRRLIRLEREARLAAIVTDLTNGLPHIAIMQKHRISSGALERILRTASAVPMEHSPDSRSRRIEMPDEVTIDFRTEPRHTPVGLILAHDRKDKTGECLLRDISMSGLCLSGARARVNETCDIAILGDGSGLVAPFELKAECRWQYDEETSGQSMAGFRITRISPRNLNRLCELIENHTSFASE